MNTISDKDKAKVKQVKEFLLGNMLVIELDNQDKLTGKLAKYKLPEYMRQKFIDVCAMDEEGYGGKLAQESFNMAMFMIEHEIYEDWLIKYWEYRFKN
jgi:transcription antitermination factor NusA-like protein